MTGFSSDDSFTGGLGNDTLTGGSGNDNYFYTRGDGEDIIIENFNQGTDTLTFTGVDSSDVTITRDGNNLTLVISESSPGAGDGGSVQLNSNGNSSFKSGVDSIVFADGIIWDDPTLRQIYIDQETTSGDDIISGFDDAQVFASSLGNDTLSGDGGNDVYEYARGDGNDIIIESSAGGIDRLELLDTDSTDFDVSIDGIAITIAIAETSVGANDGGNVVLSRALGSFAQDGTESILTSDGITFTAAQLANFRSDKLGTAGEDTLTGTSGVDSLSGRADNDYIIGGAGNDDLRGDAGDDIINGGLGADYLRGGVGDDELIGGEGNSQDLLSGDGGADLLNGGDGSDWAYYTSSAAGLTVNLDNAALNTGDAAGDSYISIENILGSRFDDNLTGDSGDNIITGSAGSDTIDGGLGIDRAVFSGSISDYILSESVGVITVTDLIGSGGTDTLTNIERLTFDEGTYASLFGTSAGETLAATTGSDLIFLRAGDDFVNASNGDDAIFGGDGNDQIIGGNGADIIDGGAGTDQARYANSSSAVFIDLAAGTASGAHAEGDTLIDIEDVFGSIHADVLTGDASDNVLTGFNGDDTLAGGEGTNTLLGGNGDDTFIGGLGADFNNGGGGFGDVIDYSGSFEGVQARLGGSQVFDGGFATGDSFQGIEDLIGSDFNDTLVGNVRANVLTGNDGDDFINGDRGNDTLLGGAGNDTIVGGFGQDTIDGGDGIDTLRYANANSRAVVDLSTGAGTAGHSFGDSITNVENLFGSAFNDVFIGDASDNVLNGWGGVDRLSGGEGNDTLIGGAGNDRFIFTDDWGQDTITDFEDGADLMDFRTVTGVDDISDLAISMNANGDAVITFGTDTITLTGIDPANITAADFLF